MVVVSILVEKNIFRLHIRVEIEVCCAVAEREKRKNMEKCNRIENPPTSHSLGSTSHNDDDYV